MATPDCRGARPCAPNNRHQPIHRPDHRCPHAFTEPMTPIRRGARPCAPTIAGVGGVGCRMRGRTAVQPFVGRTAVRPYPPSTKPNLVGGEVVQAVDQIVNRALQIARVGGRIAPLPRQNLIHQRLYLRHKGLVFGGDGRDTGMLKTCCFNQRVCQKTPTSYSTNDYM
jgi:hypothetical protein